jgi:hypothetical protein
MSQISTTEITEAFSNLIAHADEKNLHALDTASAALQTAIVKATGKKISVRLIKPVLDNNFFGMAITPDKSTIEKITEAVINQDSTIDTIREIWKRAASWRLDIDTGLLSILTAEELTALTLHEIGHMIDGDSVPTKLHEIVQFSLTTSPLAQKAMMTNKPFTKLVSLPVVVACQFSYDKNGVRKEIKADNMAARNGYAGQLVTAMGKIEQYLKNRKQLTSPVDELGSAVNYTNEVFDQLSKRKTALAKKNLLDLKKRVPSASYVFESADESYKMFFMDAAGENDSERRSAYIADLASKIAHDAYYEEIGGTKTMKPIDRNQLDYIRIKISDMKTVNDKMMIVSYINSKIELAQYYLDTIRNPKFAKKLKVPHSEEYLVYVIKELYNLRKIALAKKLQEVNYDISVMYPAGYEG